MAGPLEGLRIIDMTTMLAGPFGTQMLADLGADVIKIESAEGDASRWIGPARHPGMGSMFLQLHRNKRSVVLDLKSREGCEALRNLAAKADVLIYNQRPAAMERLGLSYADFEKSHPALIYCGILGFGRDGPYAEKPAYDDIIQAAVAMPWLQQQANGGEPRYVPQAIADRVAGLTAAFAITSALWERSRTGKGQSIDVPMFETMAQFVLSDHMYGYTFQPPVGEPGYMRLLAHERRPYRTRDGYVCVLAYTDKHCQDFFRLIERPELCNDARFVSIHARSENVNELYTIIGAALFKRDTADWLALLSRCDIPVMQVNDLRGLIDDPHLATTGFFEVHEHPSEGLIKSMAVPTAWSRTQPELRYHAPRLGQHTDEIMKELDA